METFLPPCLADRTFWAEVRHGFGPCSNGQVFFSNPYKTKRLAKVAKTMDR